ncbi:Uncharacterized protein C1494.07, partial [Araneus ventricosus]
QPCAFGKWECHWNGFSNICSLHLNPVGHLWDALGREFSTQLYPAKNTFTQLQNQLLNGEWTLLSQNGLPHTALSAWRVIV